MIKSVRIDNFKALNNFTIHLKPLTVLIGKNAVGKTSVLQAVDLIRSFATTDIDEYLTRHQWTPDDLKSQLSERRNMVFRTVFETDTGETEWEFTLTPVRKTGKIHFRGEKVTDRTGNRVLLEVSSEGIRRYNSETDEYEKFPSLNLSASFMKTVDEKKEDKKFPGLAAIKKFLKNSDFFEILSPEKMGQNSRGKPKGIGIGGEHIAAYIHGLGREQKAGLTMRLRKYADFLTNTDTRKDRQGRIEMKISEFFEGNQTNIKAMHSSAGMLRLTGISALAESGRNDGILLLDEIEDGIHPELAETLVSDLKDIAENRGRQILVTTHSTVLLDYFPETSIIYVWRDRNGRIHNREMFANEEMKASLEYMYPGEIWLNMRDKEIMGKLQGER